MIIGPFSSSCTSSCMPTETASQHLTLVHFSLSASSLFFHLFCFFYVLWLKLTLFPVTLDRPVLTLHRSLFFWKELDTEMNLVLNILNPSLLCLSSTDKVTHKNQTSFCYSDYLQEWEYFHTFSKWAERISSKLHKTFTRTHKQLCYSLNWNDFPNQSTNMAAKGVQIVQWYKGKGRRELLWSKLQQCFLIEWTYLSLQV